MANIHAVQQVFPTSSNYDAMQLLNDDGSPVSLYAVLRAHAGSTPALRASKKAEASLMKQGVSKFMFQINVSGLPSSFDYSGLHVYN